MKKYYERNGEVDWPLEISLKKTEENVYKENFNEAI